MRIVLFSALCILLLVSPGQTKLKKVNQLKYVFFFIGDGMGVAHRQIAEYYLQAKTKNKKIKLLMNSLPIAGLNTTHSLNSHVTDSSAAGTALATGYKTNNSMLGVLPNGKKLKTIAEMAIKKGWATGIISDTRVTHATPAAYLAHIKDRNKENKIAEQICKSKVSFLAGGGYRHFLPKNSKYGSKRKDDRNLIEELKKQNYKVFWGEEQTGLFLKYKPQKNQKVISMLAKSHFPFFIDRDDLKYKLPSLAQMVEKGIVALKAHNKPFFMMVEGGRIDFACHVNDLHATILEVLELDKALKVAYKFYKKHLKETLIVVTADHETGGLGLGYDYNYFLKIEPIFKTKVSVSDVLQDYYQGDKANFLKFIALKFGLSSLSKVEKNIINEAMLAHDKRKNVKSHYYTYQPTQTAVARLVSARASVYWTSFGHTAAPVALSAVGNGAEFVGGYKDNTELAKTLMLLTGLSH